LVWNIWYFIRRSHCGFNIGHMRFYLYL